MRNILTSTFLLLAVSTALLAQKLDEKIADRLYESAKVFGEVLNAPDGGIPKSLLKDAECVAVIPAVKKDEALIAEVESYQHDENNFHLWWLGQSGYLLLWKGKKILIMLQPDHFRFCE